MKANIINTTLVIASILLMFSCGESTDAVESGTYQGEVKKVVPSKSEIYVETADAKTLELYFTEETTLSRAGETVDFSTLQEGQNVEVVVEKTGKRLDPVSVEILD